MMGHRLFSTTAVPTLFQKLNLDDRQALGRDTEWFSEREYEVMPLIYAIGYSHSMGGRPATKLCFGNSL